MSLHNKPPALRVLSVVASSTIGNWNSPQRAKAFLQEWIRLPVRYATGEMLASIPMITLAELLHLPDNDFVSVRVSTTDLSRVSWDVRMDEEICLGIIADRLQAKRIFEIGTFVGRTTHRLAMSAPTAQVYTLDLPKAEIDAMKIPDFGGGDIGRMFHGTTEAARITQLHGNSLRFDFSPYKKQMDIVFVDGAHDYIHGLTDSRSALELVRPGGIVLWHDMIPNWGGLVEGVREANASYPLHRLSGTTMAVLQMPN